jgi:hypothetical protein
MQNTSTAELKPNTITVRHCAFADTPSQVGVRTITSAIVGSETGMAVVRFAELAFELTNHPAPPEFTQETVGRCPSLSVGDLVGVTNATGVTTWFLARSTGWRFLGSGRLGALFVSSLHSRWNAALAADPSSWSARRFWSDTADL